MARRRSLWIGLAAAACMLALILGLAGWAFDPASLKPRLVEAAARATGRTLTISGRIGIKLALTPTVSLEDVTLSNPPGFSRPDMVKVARVELSLALLPLLRHTVEITHIELVRPDILLEGDHSGHANWLFTRAAPPVATAAPPPSTLAPPIGQAPAGGPAVASRPVNPKKVRFVTSLRDVDIVDGRIGLLDRRSGYPVVADIQRLHLTRPAGGPEQVSGSIEYDGRVIALQAQTGTPEDLVSASDEAAWPVSMKLESGGATALLEGKIANPLVGRDYSFTVDGVLPDPSAFAALLPRLPLGSLGALVVHAEVADHGGRIPMISLLDAKLASADIGSMMHGARLENVTLSAAGTSPSRVSARLVWNGFASEIRGTAGNLAWLNGGRSGPLALDLAWSAASAKGTVRGTIQEPRRFAGFDLDVAVEVPDPALVVDGAPPALKSVTVRTRLTDTAGPGAFEVSSNAGDVEGELAITRSPRLSVAGTISSRRLDLDMLASAPAAGESGSGGSGSVPSAPVPPAAAREPLIPGTKLPIERIREADADVKFNFGQLRVGGNDISGLTGAVTLKDGVLRVDPSASDPHLNATLVVDAAETPPQLHLTLDTSGVALAPLLTALDLPRAATGTVELHADLTGTGDSPRALAASLDGWAGVAIEGGQLDAALINSWLEQLRPLRIEGADVTDLRCLAVRADAVSGIVTVDPMALNTAALIVEGTGDVDLGHETLSLRVRPRTRIGGTGIALPVRVSGKLRAPSARVDISAKGFGGGALAGLLLGGKDVMGSAGGGDPCPAALSRAREGAPPSGSKP